MSAVRAVAGFARVHHNQLGPVVAGLPQPLHHHREALGYVGAGNQNAIRERNVRHGDGRAVHAKRFCVGGARGRHAQAAVVINVTSPKPDARKLPHEITLLVGHGRAAIDSDGILPVLLLELLPSLHDVVVGLVPTGALQPALACRRDGSSDIADGRDD